MKRTFKRLVLHRETLRELEVQALQPVAAAATTFTVTGYPDQCDWSGRQSCTTCALTCTTNFC